MQRSIKKDGAVPSYFVNICRNIIDTIPNRFFHFIYRFVDVYKVKGKKVSWIA